MMRKGTLSSSPACNQGFPMLVAAEPDGRAQVTSDHQISTNGVKSFSFCASENLNCNSPSRRFVVKQAIFTFRNWERQVFTCNTRQSLRRLAALAL
eukprot:5269874-Amphidinium_carterae.1